MESWTQGLHCFTAVIACVPPSTPEIGVPLWVGDETLNVVDELAFGLSLEISEVTAGDLLVSGLFTPIVSRAGRFLSQSMARNQMWWYTPDKLCLTNLLHQTFF